MVMQKSTIRGTEMDEQEYINENIQEGSLEEIFIYVG